MGEPLWAFGSDVTQRPGGLARMWLGDIIDTSGGIGGRGWPTFGRRGPLSTLVWRPGFGLRNISSYFFSMHCRAT